jgi:hypothetical protein
MLGVATFVLTAVAIGLAIAALFSYSAMKEAVIRAAMQELVEERRAALRDMMAAQEMIAGGESYADAQPKGGNNDTKS